MTEPATPQPHHAFVTVLDHLKDESDTDFAVSGASFSVDTTSTGPGDHSEWTFLATATLQGYTTGTPADVDGHLRSVLANAPHAIHDVTITTIPHPDGDAAAVEDAGVAGFVEATVVAHVTPARDVGGQ